MLKMEMLKRQFGIAEPIRRGMELKTVREGEWKPAMLGGTAGVHRDILEGRDCEIGWEDVFTGKSEMVVKKGRKRRSGVRMIEFEEIANPRHRQRAPRSARLPR
jgi:hypothetical protein